MKNPQPLTRGVTTPTIPHVEVSQTGIDWLQWSMEWPHEITQWPADPRQQEDILRMALPPCDEIKILGEVIAPFPGYNAGTTATHARIFWHTQRAEQHIGVVMTGDDLRGLIGVAYPQSALLHWVVTHCKTITRMDLAIDVTGEGLDPSMLVLAWRGGWLKTIAKSVREMTSHTQTDKGLLTGRTVYFGSRMSDRQVRVYDKGAEMGISEQQWVRIEIQLRHDRATNIAKLCADQGIAATTQAAIRAYVECTGCSWWQQAVTGPTVEFDPIGRKDTNTERWLYNTVMPQIWRVMEVQRKRGESKLHDKLVALLKDFDSMVNFRINDPPD